MVNQSNQEHAHRLAPVCLAAAMVSLLLVPAANASHLQDMSVSQTGSAGLEVTLRVEYTITGNCCGGTFNWDIGETPTVVGSVADGTEGGVILEADLGEGQLSDGRPFRWVRSSPAANTVQLDISYSYLAFGTYTVAWNDCCQFIGGELTVSTGALGRILAIDTGHDTVPRALNAVGITPCPGPYCYELMTPSQFNPLISLSKPNLRSYDILFVGWDASQAAIDALNARSGDIFSFVSLGGAIVGYAQFDNSNPWDWIPATGTDVVNHVADHANDISLTVEGTTHPSHLGQNDVTLSGWFNSRHNSFTDWPSYLKVLATDATGSDAVTLAGEFNNGKGCVLISGQDVDLHAAGGGDPMNPTPPNPVAEELMRTTLLWAASCAQA